MLISLVSILRSFTTNRDIGGLVNRQMEVSAFDLIVLRSDCPKDSALVEMSPFAWNELFHKLTTRPAEYNSNEIKIDTIVESFRILEKVLSIPEDYVLTVTDMILRGHNALEVSDYSMCLTMAWSAIERLLNKLWDGYLDSNRERMINGAQLTFINAKRRRRLKSRDYSASVKSEILSLVDILPFTLFEKLTTARTARNDWLHGLRLVERADAMAACSTAVAMLKLAHDVELGWLYAIHSIRGPA